jgi:hypothetical protein
MFSPLFASSSSWFVWLFHSPFSYFGPYIVLNIFLSKTRRACPQTTSEPLQLNRDIWYGRFTINWPTAFVPNAFYVLKIMDVADIQNWCFDKLQITRI